MNTCSAAGGDRKADPPGRAEPGRPLRECVPERAGDGSKTGILAHYVVGCDGLHSTVRQLLQIDFSGNTYRQRVLQADVRIDWPLQHAEDEVVGFVSEHGPLAPSPAGEHRYRLMVFDAGLAPTLENFQYLVDSRGPAGRGSAIRPG